MGEIAHNQILIIFGASLDIMDKTKKYFSLLFLIVLLVDVYIYSFRLIIAIEFLIFMALVFSGARHFSYSFLKMLFPLVFIFAMGFVGMLYYHSYPPGDIIKDMSHLIKPALTISIGYMFARIFRDYSVFIKTIVTAGTIVAAVHIIKLLFLADFSSMSINAVRDVSGRDSFVELYSLWFVIASPRHIRNTIFKNKTAYIAVVLILSLSCLSYLSRAMVVAFLLLAFTLSGYSKITYKSLKIIGFIIMVIGLFYAYLFTIKLERNAKGLEAFLYKIKIAPAEIFETKIDRQNHADLWDHWRGYEMKRAFALMHDKPASYIFGTGTGSLVDLRFKAPIAEDNKGMRYISMLHNGYIFVFYKTGIIGIISLLIFLFGIYGFIYKKPYNELHKAILVTISSIGFFYLFSSIIISGVFIVKDSVIFILGGLLFYETYCQQVEEVDLRVIPENR